MPNAEVGKIQGQEFDTNNKHIVIGMLQTLSLKDDYSTDIFDDFGLIIFDECHHLSAEKFSQILRKISGREALLNQPDLMVTVSHGLPHLGRQSPTSAPPTQQTDRPSNCR